MSASSSPTWIPGSFLFPFKRRQRTNHDTRQHFFFCSSYLNYTVPAVDSLPPPPVPEGRSISPEVYGHFVEGPLSRRGGCNNWWCPEQQGCWCVTAFAVALFCCSPGQVALEKRDFNLNEFFTWLNKGLTIDHSLSKYLTAGTTPLPGTCRSVKTTGYQYWVCPLELGTLLPPN